MTVTDARPHDGPVPPGERIALLDVLRGFALWGVLIVNHGFTSGVSQQLIGFFAAGSFYPMFSLLFGLGFAIQMIRAAEAGGPFVWRYLWRLLILLVIGVVHLVYFRYNHILITYALCAVPLLLVRRWRPNALLALAALSLVLFMGREIVEDPRDNPELVQTRALEAQHTALIDDLYPPAWCRFPPGVSGRRRAEICAEAADVQNMLTTDVATVVWWTDRAIYVCMMLLGLYIGRQGIVRDPRTHARMLSWVAAVGLAVGLAGNGLDIFEDELTGVGLALPSRLAAWDLAYALGNIGLSLFYLAGIALLFTRGGFARRVFTPLANVGRMALTNFFVQPFILITLLGTRGSGLVSNIDGWRLLIVLNALFVVQIIYSNMWFRYFRIGPLEWTWRSLTWLKWQPWRVRMGIQVSVL